MTADTKDLGQVFDALHQMLLERKSADPSSSYAASLYAKGLDTILKKVGEESTEVVIAAKNPEPDKLVYELADLWFHCLVLMADRNITPQMLAEELARRMGRSGLEEKSSRQASRPQH